jgi:chromosomal replication initiator protein
MDMNIEIPNNALNYITNNVHENVRQIEGILKNLSFQARLSKQPITEDLVRSLVGYVVTGPVDINPEVIVDAVAKSTGVSREDILSKKRAKPIPLARHITCYLMSNLTDMTLIEMGNFIGRHYSTISESIQLITDEIAVDKALEKQINEIKSSLGTK